MYGRLLFLLSLATIMCAGTDFDRIEIESPRVGPKLKDRSLRNAWKNKGKKFAAKSTSPANPSARNQSLRSRAQFKQRRHGKDRRFG